MSAPLNYAALLVLAALLPTATACVLPTATTEESMIRYHVTLPERQAHRVSVRLDLEDLSGTSVDLTMPVWTPGSYLVREYARNVIELTASAADGRALTVTKPAKDTWNVALDGATAIHVDYVLYANEVSVRTSHVTDDHAYLQPAATFLRHAPSASGKHRVTLDAPGDWNIYTPLAADGEGFVAADFDELVDSPIEVGPHTEIGFEIRGVPHRLVVTGAVDLDVERMRDDIATICTEVATIFDQMPFDDYMFLVSLVDSGGGGLEHKNSSVNMFRRWGLHDEKTWRRFLSLIAHEYFHAWNVKRFRPEALGPFDYDTENYTPDLWVAEGITSYYDDLATLRAGFGGGASTYLSDRAGAFKAEAERPGSDRMSLTESSLDTWIKQYRPDENSRNVSVSYYSKGALVAFMLDLRIRRLTDGDKTLADVLRLGWERYAARDVGFPPGTIRALANEVTGADMDGFFDDAVEGVSSLDPNADLAWVGLTLERKPSKTDRPLPEDDQGRKLAPRLGVSTGNRDGLCVIDVVFEDGAAFAAGLNHDDVILAIDGFRVSGSNLGERLDRTAGDAVTLTYWRGEELRSVTLTPELLPLEDWKIVSVDEPTDAQLMAYATWLGEDHPKAPKQDGQDDGATGDQAATETAHAKSAG